jgi:Na+-driven multidrug efflux pump
LSRIVRFWLPLASTWLMMSLEGPFLAAIIARLGEPKINLAAYGVAFAVAILVEAPVIMMLSASTALVVDADSLVRVRRFSHTLSLALTLFMGVMLATPLWLMVARDLMGLPPDVANLTQEALILLLPWPAAIGYRRFYQGLLIRHGMPRRVAYGTVVRMCTMAATALLMVTWTGRPGAVIAAAALSAGVLVEAVVSRAMAIRVVRELTARPRPAAEEPLTTVRILRFYAPLAMTSVISMVAHPLVTFFMGRAPASLESLAVLPVINSLVFIFRAMGLAFQDVAIALLAENPANRPPVVRFAAFLGIAATMILALIAFTPLAGVWFITVSGLAPDLADFALQPLRIMALMPALSVLLSLQRATLVHARRTKPITYATAVELSGIALLLAVCIGWFGLDGAVAAALAFMGGRLLGNLSLLRPMQASARG